ncbi:MAG TPA: hypothetical protein DCQ64_15955 [Candidatus Rokubacteria bacterium]|nr:hypothetical protein [Candidatus Rokubacteria bacterium]
MTYLLDELAKPLRAETLATAHEIEDAICDCAATGLAKGGGLDLKLADGRVMRIKFAVAIIDVSRAKV